MVHLTRRDYLVAAGVAVAVLALGASRLVPGVCGGYHDDAIYVATAKALATGKGYRLIDLPGAPLQTKYPILYPAILATIWRLWPTFPDNLLAMQLLSLLSAAGALGLSYLLLVRFNYGSRAVVSTGVGLCATAPFMLYLSTQTLSEMPFALLVVIAAWRLEVVVLSPQESLAREVSSGFVLALPLACRTIGLALLVGALVLLLRAKRRVTWTALGGLALAAPWFTWAAYGLAHGTGDAVTGYYRDYLGSWVTAGRSSALSIPLINSVVLLIGPAHLLLSGISSLWFSRSQTLWNLVFLASGLAVWTLALGRALASRPLPVLIGLYVLTVVVWPWPPTRFLAPVLPLVIGSVRIAGLPSRAWVRSRVFRAATWGCIAVIAASNLVLNVRLARQARATGYPYNTIVSQPAEWTSYERVFRWIRQNTAPTQRIAAGLDTMVYLYTGRQAFRPFAHRPDALFYGAPGPRTGTLDDLFRNLRIGGADYLVALPMPGFAEEEPFTALVNRALRMYPDRLKVVYSDPDPRFMVLAVRGD
jgi:hypothetical protein